MQLDIGQRGLCEDNQSNMLLFKTIGSKGICPRRNDTFETGDTSKIVCGSHCARARRQRLSRHAIKTELSGYRFVISFSAPIINFGHSLAWIACRGYKAP